MARDLSKLCGWNYDPRAVDEYLSRTDKPVFGVAAHEIKDSGKGKVQLLYKFTERIAGGVYPLRNQTVGDCVSQGSAGGIDTLKGVQCFLKGTGESWEAETASEPIYWASRVEIGKGRLGTDDGSVGAWAVEAMKRYGTLVRKAYQTSKAKYDFTKYSGSMARKYGVPGKGLPDDLEPLSMEHLLKHASLVMSYEEVRDAIYNGYPVIVCSNYGFSNKRDAKGFARPEGKWAHCMLFHGVDDEDQRPGCCCQNSWNVWNSGPKRHDQPDGSFWTDAEIVDKMVKQFQDSYALTSYEGFPAQVLDYTMG